MREGRKQMHVLRVYHGGRDQGHRERERALVDAHVDVTLVVPETWPGTDAGVALGATKGFEILELPTRRPGDVNRHAYDPGAIAKVLRKAAPDVLDIHEEPFSVAARQWLSAAPPTLPVVMYTAQNIDKRFPPPFFSYERRAHERVAAFYPCSKQAASVTRGKGFRGEIDVIPLGYDASLYRAGEQTLADAEVVLGLFGRLVPEKGVLDAVRVLASVNEVRPARLWLVGGGSEEQSALRLARALGVGDRILALGQRSGAELAGPYRRTHVTLVPSRTTATWVEQFGRVIVEAQASGSVVAGYSSGTIGEVAGPAGALTTEGDVSGLASLVIDLLTDPEEYGRRRAEGLRSAQSRTWTEIARRQAAVYERVLNGGPPVVVSLAGPTARRLAARREFGPTAATKDGRRPFALPLLRRGGAVARALATSIDATAEMWVRLGRGHPRI